MSTYVCDAYDTNDALIPGLTIEYVDNGLGKRITATVNGNSSYYSLDLANTESHKGIQFNSIARAAFENDVYILNLTVSYNISTIDTYSFSGCTYLQTVYMNPGSITTINDYVFNNCGSLTTITIPSAVVSIGNYAFSNCSGLITLQIPSGLQSLGNNVFEYCDSLTKLVLPNTITSIGESVFYNCTSLNSVNIPVNSSITRISNNLFFGCSSLESITIPSYITSIGDYSFFNCFQLAVMNIEGNPFTSVGTLAFTLQRRGKPKPPPTTNTIIGYVLSGKGWTAGSYSRIPNLQIHIQNSCQAYDKSGSPITNLLLTFEDISGDNKKITGYKYTSVGTPFILDLGATASNNTSITFTKIGDEFTYPFRFLTDITEIVIPDSITSIAPNAFSGCTALATITFSGTSPVTLIDVGTFSSVAITTITLPPNLITISDFAFNSAASLQTIIIPASVTTIGQGAFTACESLRNITFLGTQSSITSVMYKTDGKVNSFPHKIPPIIAQPTLSIGTTVDGWKYGTSWNGLLIGGLSFIGFDLEGHIIDDFLITYEYLVNNRDVKILGYSYSGSLSNFSIDLGISASKGGVHITEIGDDSTPPFKNLTQLTGIRIPNTVTIISKESFQGCTHLTTVFLPKLLSIIKSSTFEGCTSFVEILIPAAVDKIEERAFKGCTSMKEFIFERTRESIPGAFATFVDDNDISNSFPTSNSPRPEAIGVDWTPSTDSSTYFYGLNVPPSLYCSGYNLSGNLISNLKIYYFSINSEYTILGYSYTGTNNFTLSIDKTSTEFAKTHSGAVFSIIGEAAFLNCTKLTSLLIHNNVTVIYDSAFEGCTNLTTVSLTPNTVLGLIGASAFQGCTHLTSIVIPNSVKSIGESTFQGCSMLNSVTLPTGLIIISDNLFKESGITHLTVPTDVSEIGNGAFYSCASLHTITLPAATTIIGNSAFLGAGLTSITLPDTLEIIGELALSHTRLTSITMPKLLTQIGLEAFGGVTTLASITFVGQKQNISASEDSFRTGYLPITIAYGEVANGWQPGQLWNGLMIPKSSTALCMTEGTRVLTPSGYRLVEQLEKFDYITTADGRNVMIKHVHYSQHYYVGELEAPFFVPAHALAENVPSHDIKLSPDHLVHVGDDLWLTPRGMAKRSNKVVQYDIGKTIHYYTIMTPNYFQDNLVIEDGVVVEAYGARDLVYDEEKKAYRRKPMGDL